MTTNRDNFNSNDRGLNEILKSYTKHWKWFLFSILISLSLALLYLRYTTQEYAAFAKIQILEDQGTSSGLSVFQDLGIMSGSAKQVEDEIQLINSRSNFIEAVKKLRLNTRIISLGKITNSEIYNSPPFKVNFIAPDSVVFNSHYEFYITLTSNTTFGFTEKEDIPDSAFGFGKNINSAIGDIVLTPNLVDLAGNIGKRFQVIVEPVNLVAEKYQKKLTIIPNNDLSNIANISLTDPIPNKAKDLIDLLINIYNANAVLDKKIIADRTSDFINERIANISSNLTSVDETAEEFKSDRKITDIASEANLNLNIGAANRQELRNASVQLDIASSMRDIVDNQEGFEPLPANIGLADASIAATTSRYNDLALERKRLLKSSNEKNPIIVNLDQQLAGLKRNVQSSLNSMSNNLSLTVNSLSSQQAQLNSRIYSVPKNERLLRDITRKQQTTEALYLYLLQKREESQIAYASATPKSNIIDNAYSSFLPVSPKNSTVFLTSIILGLLLPFSIIYANDLLDNKIHNKTGLEMLVKDTPVLGEIPKLSKKDEKLIVKEDRSVMAESLRILRTNLDYLIKTKEFKTGNNNIVFVTSSVSGEGKTFLSTNLSMILASTNKKVLLIGADIRNPKLYSFFTSKEVDKLIKPSKDKESGLTEYLYDDTLRVKDIINPMLVHSNVIDVIYSGKIPPNPSELLLSKRVGSLFEEVSEMYDYVIVDTAPLMVVTDTLLISEFANHIIYVTRAGVTENKAIQFPLKLMEEGKIKGLSFVVNDVKATNLGYGGKYGYGYSKTIKKWWKF